MENYTGKAIVVEVIKQEEHWKYQETLLQNTPIKQSGMTLNDHYESTTTNLWEKDKNIKKLIRAN